MEIKLTETVTFYRIVGKEKSFVIGTVLDVVKKNDEYESWLTEYGPVHFSEAEEIPEPPEGYRIVKSNHAFGDFAFIDKGDNRVEGFGSYDDAVKAAHAVDTAHKKAVAAAKAYDVFANAPVALAKVSDTGFLCVLKDDEWVPVCAMEFRQWRMWKAVFKG